MTFGLNHIFLRKKHEYLMELKFEKFTDDGNLVKWKSEKTKCELLVFTGLVKINKNTIQTYKVNYSLNMKVQVNTLEIQGVIHVLSFPSSSKTLTPSNLHQNVHRKLHWKHKNY